MRVAPGRADPDPRHRAHHGRLRHFPQSQQSQRTDLCHVAAWVVTTGPSPGQRVAVRCRDMFRSARASSSFGAGSDDSRGRQRRAAVIGGAPSTAFAPTLGKFGGASLHSKQRFLRHARVWWEVHRHRMAPEVEQPSSCGARFRAASHHRRQDIDSFRPRPAPPSCIAAAAALPSRRSTSQESCSAPGSTPIRWRRQTRCSATCWRKALRALIRSASVST